jgi:entericidin B
MKLSGSCDAACLRRRSAHRLPGASTVARFARRINMNRLIALFLLAGTALLTGCNTVAGAGQDISNGGHAITHAADQAQD